MDNKEKILNKIKKCLALSKSANPQEAAIALKQAQALMQEYNVTQTDVMFSDVQKQASNSQATEKRPQWDHYLMWVVAQAFGCKTLIGFTSKNFVLHSVVNFIGVIAHDGAREALSQLFKLNGELGKSLVRYLALFRPESRDLSLDRVAKLLSEVLPDVHSGRISRNGQMHDAPLPAWILALEQAIQARDQAHLITPLKSHGYLYEVLSSWRGQGGAEIVSLEGVTKQAPNKGNSKTMQGMQALGDWGNGDMA